MSNADRKLLIEAIKLLVGVTKKLQALLTR